MQAPRKRSGSVSPCEFRLRIRVYYEDTDAGGVVYYANYLKFCERGRTEWLRSLGFGQQQLIGEAGIAFVVRSIKAEFRAPARLDDELDVVTVVERVGGASVHFSQRILRGEAVLFEALVVVACLDLAKQRPTPIPADIRQGLGQPT